MPVPVPAPGRLLLLFLLLLASACSRAPVPARTPPAAEAPLPPPPPDVGPLTPADAPIALMKSAVATQWFWLRAKTLEGGAPPGFEEATATMRELKDTIGPDTIVWEDLEGAVLGVATAHDLPSAVGALPTLEDDPSRVTLLRLAGLRAARSVAATEGHYRRTVYGEHAQEVTRAAATLAALLLPRAGSALTAMRDDLGAPWPDVPVVLTLVYDAPFRGSDAPKTAPRALGRFLRVRGVTGPALVESAITEILLGFDEQAQPDDTSALQKLRAALVRRGLAHGDPAIELATHALAASEARALVARLLPKETEPSTEPPSCALYPPACVIDEVWQRRTMDRTPVDATVEVLADAVAASP